MTDQGPYAVDMPMIDQILGIYSYQKVNIFTLIKGYVSL